MKPEIKYEDKYLDDIKNMISEYKFTWSDLALRDNKFNELYDAHKTNLVYEKYKLNEAIVEKSFKYIEIDDDSENDYENINDNDSESVSNEEEEEEEEEEKEERKKIIELEIIELRSKLKELEDISEDEVMTKLKSEADDFVVKERLDGLKNNFIMEKTPLGNVIMYWNNSRESFEYYSDNVIPYRYLDTVCRKYVIMNLCRPLYVDMNVELCTIPIKPEMKKEVIKKNVFAKLKNYKKQTPNMTQSVTKTRMNKYLYHGRINNFNCCLTLINHSSCKCWQLHRRYWNL